MEEHQLMNITLSTPQHVELDVFEFHISKIINININYGYGYKYEEG